MEFGGIFRAKKQKLIAVLDAAYVKKGTDAGRYSQYIDYDGDEWKQWARAEQGHQSARLSLLEDIKALAGALENEKRYDFTDFYNFPRALVAALTSEKAWSMAHFYDFYNGMAEWKKSLAVIQEFRLNDPSLDELNWELHHNHSRRFRN